MSTHSIDVRPINPVSRDRGLPLHTLKGWVKTGVVKGFIERRGTAGARYFIDVADLDRHLAEQVETQAVAK